MNAKSLATLLKRLGACGDAVQWAKGKSLKEVWATCARGDWMLWLCGRMDGKLGWATRQELVLAACDCAELALPGFEKEYPDDKRPRTAIETARKWANGEATREEVRTAADAAAYAAHAAYAADAAAHAADAAAYAAPHAAAKTNTLITCADICRKRLYIPE